ncbi:reprolysin-like metallopeptidase [Geodermatophilus poikilotrophus]|uniref:Metallo-peptidase family M12B Reprolysin-like n=1 Tax=Geodermatophilus poikilotrophus TaxID=1333667 RepID=A0A1I0H487_9ACTN|nr:hypothetical protein [Geodermatophilus poikilotrophus]SET78427.1 Metallo-peptidase family M12B Reprolysin-like [Geodermatophilus poikilotrophus]
MPSLRPSRLLVLALATAAVLPVVVAPPAATAEEPPAAVERFVGELVQGYADPAPADVADGAHEDDGRLLSWVQSDDGETVRVPTEDVDHVEVGSTVEVTLGGAVVDEAVQEGLGPAQEVLATEVLAAPEEPATASATTPVNHPVTVVMLQPANTSRDGVALAQVVQAVNGPVADFWEQQTRGAVRFGVTATVDWGEPATVGCAEPFELWRQAADRARWTWSDNAHLLVYVPAGATQCAYGLGTIGTWIGDGGLAYVTATGTSVIAHELGHNLGLGHSSALQCDGSVDIGLCRVAPYQDHHDVMGVSWEQLGSLNAVHGAHLGVLAAHPVHWYAGSRTVFELPPVSATSGWQAIELVSEDGTRHLVEYRSASGQDAWLGTTANRAGVDAGVQVRLASEGADTSLLLDATPSPMSGWGSDRAHAVPVGATVSVRDGEFLVTVESISPTMARLLVATRVSAPASEIERAYRAIGGAAGPLGRPVSAEVCGLRDGGCFRHFERGSVYWSPATGARVVSGAVRDRWAATGWESGGLGYPVTDTVCGLRDGGCFQHFRGGSVYWSPATGARALTTALRNRWAELGWENGGLGYPVSDQVCGLPDSGCFVHFQGGSLYSSAATGVHEVVGVLRDRWAATGWERGPLGYPGTHTVCGLLTGGCFQHFQGGSVYSSPATGARWIHTALRASWAANGWEGGPLGYPRTDTLCGLRAGGCLQEFQGGTVYFSPATGAYAVTGAIRGAWGAAGWESGSLGYPAEERRITSWGVSQRFQGGTLVLDHRTGQVRRV